MSAVNQSPSPVVTSVDDVFKRRNHLKQSRDALPWALINLTFVFIFLIDMKYSLITDLVIPELLEPVFYIIEILLTIILLCNTIYDVALYSWPYFWMKPIEVTETQMKLLGIKPNEFGFRLNSSLLSSPSKGQKISPKTYPATPPFEIGTLPSPSFAASQHTSLSSLNSSLMSNISQTPNVSAINDSVNSPLNSTASSWVYHRAADSFIESPSHNDDTKSSLRLRKNQRMSGGKVINDEKSLNEYLKEFDMREERDEEMRHAEKQHEQSMAASPWNAAHQTPVAADQSSSYQLAVQSPLISAGGEDIDKALSITSSFSSADLNILTKLKITEIEMNQWIENIRKWICQTILMRLIQEIDKINDSLVKMGSVDSLIGEASLSSIKQMSILKKAQIPSFESLVPYLDVTVHQQYLIKRIKDLAKGGCMSEFNWNGGGYYNRKQWNEDLPSDSAIIMHCFCTYMDSRLPSNPNCPEGKAFTNLHFRSISGQTPKDRIYISQIKVNPPHYKVVSLNEEVWELPIGRNNLFYTFLVFLYCVKLKYYGLLGRVNLGPSGVNILWVINRIEN